MLNFSFFRDFADEFPHIEVVGTDLSPIQPSWVPPNVRFEIDDLTQPWTWKEGSFDFVHMRNLCGSVSDWPVIFREAYRVLSPGSWVESRELEAVLYSDDGTVEPGSALDTWGRLFTEAGKRIGKSFTVLVDDVQQIGIRAAGFVDVHAVDYKVPLGGWPANPKLKEIGQFAQLTAENDMEGGFLIAILTTMSPGHEFVIYADTDLRVLAAPLERRSGLAEGGLPDVSYGYPQGNTRQEHPFLL